MNRKYIIENVINAQILPQINAAWTWHDIAPAKELVKLVSDYRRAQIEAGNARKDDTLTAKVIDGALYLNNDFIKRIAPKDPRPAYNEAAYYWEGRILARQEAAYID
jgi:hypothetical protein